MNTVFQALSGVAQHGPDAALVVDALIKSVLVLGAAALLCVCAKRMPAAARHLIWFLAIAALPCLPLLSAWLPSWEKPIWSVSSTLTSGNQISMEIELAPPGHQRESVAPPNDTALESNPVQAGAAPANRPSFGARFHSDWLIAVSVVWLGGALWILFSIAIGRAQLRRLERRAQLLTGPEWDNLANSLRGHLGIRRPVQVLRSGDELMPMTWGWLRPVVLLPASADEWSVERKRIVLEHEFAHIKRWDSLVLTITRIVCALYWVNPLIWMAERRMRLEREQACDDLVLSRGCKASSYAAHLVEIARSFRPPSLAPAIAMARSSQLQGRIAAIVDGSRRRQFRWQTATVVAVVIGSLVMCVGGWGAGSTTDSRESNRIRQQQISRLKDFSAAKENQAKTIAAAAGEQIGPDYQQLFDAGTRGDGVGVTNLFEDFKHRHGQYEHANEVRKTILPHTEYWSPVLEVTLAYADVMNGEPKYVQMAEDDIINSIPRGSIYFGGTDPGRGLPTTFSKSQINADPFYVLTQNALADSTYLKYLQLTYGDKSKLLESFIKARNADSELQKLDVQRITALQRWNDLYTNTNVDLHGPEITAAQQVYSDLSSQAEKLSDEIWVKVAAQSAARLNELKKEIIYTPTSADSQKSFENYIEDAKNRLAEHKLKPGENVVSDNGRIQVSGQVAVMAINGLLAKIVFDKNPNHEFYIEESFPLDWMYPYLEPHGLIMKLNREPLAEISQPVVQKDRDYWNSRISRMIGNWLTEDTPVKDVAAFAEKVYVRKDLSGFKGDPAFARSDWAQKFFSKERSSIAGVYAWRAKSAEDPAEKARMTREADFAFRQAWALCPYSPEALFRYVDLLSQQHRTADAVTVAEAASHADPRNVQIRDVIRALQQSTGKQSDKAPEKSSFLQFRRVVDTPSDATEAMTHSVPRETGADVTETFYVDKTVLLDNDSVRSAKVVTDVLGHRQIEIRMTDAGANRFAEITEQNLHKRLAIVIDGKVQCAPVVQSTITGGTAVISGEFTRTDAEFLADRINAASAR